MQTLAPEVNTTLSSSLPASGVRVVAYDSLQQISRAQWEEALTLATPLRYDFLSTVERSGINDLRYRYLRLLHGEQDIGRANLFLSETDFSTFDATLPASAWQTIKRWYPDFMKFKVLECGFFTMVGEALAVDGEEWHAEALRALAAEMAVAGAALGADFHLIRDVPWSRYRAYRDVLRPLGFYPVLGFPNAVLPIRWRRLDDYLAALNSKTRLKFRNSLKLERFGLEVEVCADYGRYASELAALWKNVHEKSSDYSREFLDERFFATAAVELQGRSETLIFRWQGQIVAFMFNLFGDDDYIVLDWGVDYSFPHYKEANLYRVATLLSLERAIALGKDKMELGITNYTPKMTLGAEVVPLVYFVRHKHDTAHSKTLSKLLANSIVQPDTSVHDAPTRTGVAQADLAAIEAQIKQDRDDVAIHDVFNKVDRYYRAGAMRMSGIYGLYPEFSTAQESSIAVGARNDVVLLGTNSYLGVARHPDVLAAAKRALDRYGSGCSGSPLLNGTLDIHTRLEEELAQFLRREAVVLCSTGYQTNLAGLSALCGPGDLVLMDARNHRSLFDGVRLSGAECLVYRHNDMVHLHKLLSRTADRRKMIVTDSLFSMEGTVADLREVSRLARLFDARLFVDESHAVGVLGEHGRGVCELQGVEGDVDVVMGTFSKSFAALGGFLAGRREVIDYIKHNAGGHIFSASLPAAVIETVRAVLQIIVREPDRRRQILEKAKYMAAGLAALGYRAEFRGSQIVPVTLGNYSLALAAYKRFMDSGVYVNPIGPPAVPENAAGFRTSYIATHEWQDLDRALQVFEKHRADFTTEAALPTCN